MRNLAILAALGLILARGVHAEVVFDGSLGPAGPALPGVVGTTAVDYLIDVPSDDTPRIQEVHGLVVHLLCQIVEEAA